MCTCLQTTAAEIVRTSKKTPGQVMEQIMHTNFSQNKNMHNLPCRQRFHQRKTMLATQIKKLKMLVMHFQFCQKKSMHIFAWQFSAGSTLSTRLCVEHAYIPTTQDPVTPTIQQMKSTRLRLPLTFNGNQVVIDIS
jgi:hypothetical protein